MVPASLSSSLREVHRGKRIRSWKDHILREHDIKGIPCSYCERGPNSHALPEILTNGLAHHLPAAIPRGISGRVGVETVVAIRGQRDPGRDEREDGRGAIALPEMPVHLIAEACHARPIHPWHAAQR